MSEDVVAYKVATGPARDSQIYVSWQSRKALGMIAKARKEPVDALGNQIIDEWLLANHKAVVEHVAAQQKAQDEFQRELNGRLGLRDE